MFLLFFHTLPSPSLSLPLSPPTQEQPLVPKLVYTLCQSLPGWRREHADLPALSWTNFHAKTRDLVNPLVSEAEMKTVASALHDMGEVRRGAKSGTQSHSACVRHPSSQSCVLYTVGGKDKNEK